MKALRGCVLVVGLLGVSVSAMGSPNDVVERLRRFINPYINRTTPGTLHDSFIGFEESLDPKGIGGLADLGRDKADELVVEKTADREIDTILNSEAVLQELANNTGVLIRVEVLDTFSGNSGTNVLLGGTGKSMPEALAQGLEVRELRNELPFGTIVNTEKSYSIFVTMGTDGRLNRSKRLSALYTGNREYIQRQALIARLRREQEEQKARSQIVPSPNPTPSSGGEKILHEGNDHSSHETQSKEPVSHETKPPGNQSRENNSHEKSSKSGGTVIQRMPLTSPPDQHRGPIIEPNVDGSKMSASPLVDFDWGLSGTRIWRDIDGDGNIDFCRISKEGTDKSQIHFKCTLATGKTIDHAYDGGTSDGYLLGKVDAPRWVDLGESRILYLCGIILSGTGGAKGWPHCVSALNATRSPTSEKGNQWNSSLAASPLDLGIPMARAWTDFNGDGIPDFCTFVVLPHKKVPSAVCYLGSPSGIFDESHSIVAENLVWDATSAYRIWIDINFDGKTDFCTLAGSKSEFLDCTISRGNAFGDTYREILELRK